jgi:hypothetical protein
MKIKNIYLLVLTLVVLVSACELPDNINPKAAVEVPTETLLTNAIVTFVDGVDEISQNVNITRFMAQYASQTAYTDPSRYEFADRQIPDGYWNQMYRMTLIDFKDAKTQIAALEGNAEFIDTRDNKLAIIDVMEVYVYQTLVDIFGDVPYSEAVMGPEVLQPVYDDAKTIYLDLLTRLSADITTLSDGNGGSWGAEEIFYGGDTDMWAKAAATLKLRIAMRLADTDAAAAQSNANAAIASGIIAAEEEGMIFNWLGVSPHVNTMYNRFIVDGRTDYAPSKTIMDKMAAVNDPRMASYFAQVDTSTEEGVEKLIYYGLVYGMEGSVNVNNYSTFAPLMFAADYPTTMIGYDEVEFLLAEVAQRWGTAADAQMHYEAGITASVAHWGGDVTTVPAYLLEADVAWDVARWKELLGTQKWIALYNRGNEGYASWRSFDWPVMSPPSGMTQGDIPLRWPYPFNEIDLNPTSYAAASTAIGGDDVRTALFWDATPNSATPAAN